MSSIMNFSPEPDGALQNCTQKKTPSLEKAAFNDTTVESTHNGISGYADESKDVSSAKQIQASRHSQYYSNVPRRNARTRKSRSSNMEQRENSCCQKLFDQINVLSAHMNGFQSTLGKWQQEKLEKPALQRELEEVQDKLQDCTEELQTTKKKWRNLASEFSRFRSQETRLHQLDDSELISLVKQLRCNIRHFAAQYSAACSYGKPEETRTGSLWKYLSDAIPRSHGYQALSKARVTSIIQSFLWRLLVGVVFEKFFWAPNIGDSISQVYEALKPVHSTDLHREESIAPEAEHSFQMWKVSTSSLILELEFRNYCDVEAHRNAVATSICNLSEQALNVIGRFVKDFDQGIQEDLQHIIERSINLDQKISRQAARIDWIFPPSQDLVTFDQNIMATEISEVAPQSGQDVNVVLAPALRKRGRSTGEDFEHEYLLLKMDVTCML